MVGARPSDTPLALREKNSQARGKIRGFPLFWFSLSRKTDRVPDLAISTSNYPRSALSDADALPGLLTGDDVRRTF